MSETHVRSSTEGHVRTLTLARADKKNALTIAMYERLVALLDEAATDRGVHVVVITGEGSAFTGGNDLADFMGHPTMDEAHPVLRFLRTLVDFEKPIVAAVNGVAVGIGTTLLLHCDLVYAAASARFSLPFVNLGLVPEAASSILLPRSSGLQLASEYLLLGEPFDAAAAHRAGIVNEVVADGELAAKVGAKAALLAERPPEAVRASKKLLRGPLRAEVHETIRREGAIFVERLASPETAEAISAFFEKRKPDFGKLG